MKQNFYFKHDAPSATNPKLAKLLQKEGARGYGVYWLLIELLRLQTDFSLPVTETAGLVSRLGYTQKTVVVRVIENIPVCMGTDAYTHDMLESLKVFLIIQRHNAAMPNVGWCEAMTMLFENNAKMASKYFDRKLGVLEAGAAADVIVMDYKPFTPLSEENIDGHMLFGMMGKNCRTTIINGRVLYKDREFVGIDEDKINAWTMAESKKLWSTLNDRVY